MAKKKVEFNLEEFKEAKVGVAEEHKPEIYLDCGDAFLEASGVRGPACGHINMLIGHSDTGKSTAMTLAAADAQRKGMLPVLIITEGKFSFEHAQMLGFQCERSNGTWKGNFIYKDAMEESIEDIMDFMNMLLDEQEKGNLPHSLVFCWDSVGSVPSNMVMQGKGSKMQIAGLLSEKIGLGFNRRIWKSRRLSEKYTNTLILVNQVWFDSEIDNIFSKGQLKAKGGEALWLNSSVIIQFGKDKFSGVANVVASATKKTNDRKIGFAKKTKILVKKNHITGLTYSDGYLIVTPHGYIANTTPAQKEYRDAHIEYLASLLGVDPSEVSDLQVEATKEDIMEEFGG